MYESTIDLIPEGDLGSFHLPNAPGEEFRRIFARTPNESSPLNMRVKLVEVHHGKMAHEGANYGATLLVFEFRFQSRLQERRYKMASVTLEFLDKGGLAKRDPVVVDLAPDRVHWLNKTAHDMKTSYGASVSANGGIAAVTGQATVHWDVEETRPLNFKATLTGSPGRSKRKVGEENAVTWTMQENVGETDGIPSFLQTAVLLKRSHSGPFYARLRVKSEVDLVSATRRFLPLTTDEDEVIDPVTFMINKLQVQNFSVTGIKDEDINHMERLQMRKFFKVNLSEEDPLTYPSSVVEMVCGTSTPSPTITSQPSPATATIVQMPISAAEGPILSSPLPPSSQHPPATQTRLLSTTPTTTLLKAPSTVSHITSAAAAVAAAAQATTLAAQATTLAAQATAQAAQAAVQAAEAAAQIAEAAANVAAVVIRGPE